jgi:DNA-binding PadR family transcriptional regulator
MHGRYDREGRHDRGNPEWNNDFGNWRMRFGRKGFMRPLVLRILESDKMTGMEIMDKMQEMSMGWWRPSPGSIYPLLDQLVEEEVLKKDSDGKYEISQKYRQSLGGSGEVDDMLTNMEGNVSYLEDMAKSSKEKLSEYKGRIEKLARRLDGLK